MNIPPIQTDIREKANKKKKIKRIKRDRVFSPKVKYTSKCWWGIIVIVATASSLAKKAKGLTAGASKTCSNKIWP